MTELTTMRKVLIFNPAMPNNKTVFETRANTFGELKVDLRNNGIENIDSFKITEGRVGVSFETDTAALPRRIKSSKGDITDNLVLIMTPKKIDNGSDITIVISRFIQDENPETLSRAEIYEIIANIKENYGMNTVRELFGNYTTQKTEDLISVLTELSNDEKREVEQERKEQREEVTKQSPEEGNYSEEKLVDAFKEGFNEHLIKNIREEIYNAASALIDSGQTVSEPNLTVSFTEVIKQFLNFTTILMPSQEAYDVFMERVISFFIDAIIFMVSEMEKEERKMKEHNEEILDSIIDEDELDDILENLNH